MKKAFKSIFIIGMMVSPFFFSACEEDHGTTNYNNVDDDDWKKKEIVNGNYPENELLPTTSLTNE